MHGSVLSLELGAHIHNQRLRRTTANSLPSPCTIFAWTPNSMRLVGAYGSRRHRLPGTDFVLRHCAPSCLQGVQVVSSLGFKFSLVPQLYCFMK
jgi:hypothetical protein